MWLALVPTHKVWKSQNTMKRNWGGVCTNRGEQVIAQTPSSAGPSLAVALMDRQVNFFTLMPYSLIKDRKMYRPQ